MSIRVRAAETAAVVELLEQEFDTAGELANELIKLVATLLAEREAFAVGEGGIAWGLWHDLRSAQKAAESIGGRVAKVYPPAPLERRLAAFSEPAERGLCPECEHPWFAHLNRAWREGKRKTGPMNDPGCLVDNCGCAITSERKAS